MKPVLCNYYKKRTACTNQTHAIILLPELITITEKCSLIQILNITFNNLRILIWFCIGSIKSNNRLEKFVMDIMGVMDFHTVVSAKKTILSLAKICKSIENKPTVAKT